MFSDDNTNALCEYKENDNVLIPSFQNTSNQMNYLYFNQFLITRQLFSPYSQQDDFNISDRCAFKNLKKLPSSNYLSPNRNHRGESEDEEYSSTEEDEYNEDNDGLDQETVARYFKSNAFTKKRGFIIKDGVILVTKCDKKKIEEKEGEEGGESEEEGEEEYEEEEETDEKEEEEEEEGGESFSTDTIKEKKDIQNIDVSPSVSLEGEKEDVETFLKRKKKTGVFIVKQQPAVTVNPAEIFLRKKSHKRGASEISNNDEKENEKEEEKNEKEKKRKNKKKKRRRAYVKKYKIPTDIAKQKELLASGILKIDESTGFYIIAKGHPGSPSETGSSPETEERDEMRIKNEQKKMATLKPYICGGSDDTNTMILPPTPYGKKSCLWVKVCVELGVLEEGSQVFCRYKTYESVGTIKAWRGSWESNDNEENDVIDYVVVDNESQNYYNSFRTWIYAYFNSFKPPVAYQSDKSSNYLKIRNEKGGFTKLSTLVQMKKKALRDNNNNNNETETITTRINARL